MKSASKTVLIPWSGGVDSTYLIYNNLVKGNNVVSGSIAFLNNLGQSFSEMIARKNNLKLLKEVAEEYDVEFHYDIQNCMIVRVPNNHYAIGQLPLVAISSGYFNYYNEDIDEVQFGYIRTDSLFLPKKNFDKALTETYDTMHSNNWKGKYQPIKYPLWNTNKIDILAQLPEEILENCSYCETPYKLSDEQYDKMQKALLFGEEYDVDFIDNVERTINCNCDSCEAMRKAELQLKYISKPKEFIKDAYRYTWDKFSNEARTEALNNDGFMTFAKGDGSKELNEAKFGKVSMIGLWDGHNMIGYSDKEGMVEWIEIDTDVETGRFRPKIISETFNNIKKSC